MEKTAMKIKWVGVPKIARDAIREEIRAAVRAKKYSIHDVLVCSETSANQKARQNIRESLWAFKASFILQHSKVDLSKFSTHEANYINESFIKMQEKLCEGANELVFAMLKSFKSFWQAAVAADGRGHFLSQYDSVEHCVKFGNSSYYFYLC